MSALAVAPAATAFADPAPVTSTVKTTAPVAAPTAEAHRYAEREATDANTTKVADFDGGRRIYIIGGSALTLALLIVLLLILV
jgi:hypothetical protein